MSCGLSSQYSFSQQHQKSWEVLSVTLYTPSEVAGKLKVKSVTVLRMFDAGVLPGVILRQGIRKRIIRFREEAVEKFLTTREKRGGQAEVGRGHGK
ncbi:MAG: DNA-binding protein [Deltaproteobacteria bacterium]|nr:DNA-binding protein [Deltaproteobacteria bacterium]